MAELALCIHGHFYQPPRENPFTGSIPVEPGAEPFQNFNEKIHQECYKPNAELGNFDRISFNFGPTLACWLEKQFPTTYSRIVTSDQLHERVFGVGNGMAQTYNHTIMPLATQRDKMTQIAWGIADFRHRFGHTPQGMWLPEMAVDLATLEAMENQGLYYTLLCPHQVRQLNGNWVDSRDPCFVRLPNGRQLTVFLRDEELSNRLAFDPALTTDARTFMRWCKSTIRKDKGFFIIATDGETFGHHQPDRQFFLQSLLRSEAVRAGFDITVPGAYLRDHPPTQEVKLVENTAWSCAHGVARWSTGCSCTPGNQQWKSRLRAAIDRLSGAVDALYQSECRQWIPNPWALRNSYINVILGRIDGLELLQQFASSALPTDTAVRLLRLLEAERHCQSMYTSCGWYFEDLSRIETRNNICYAAKAIEQVELATDIDLSTEFGQNLAAARSWITDDTGKDIYERVVAERQA